MQQTCLPMLVVRTRNATAAVEMNGVLMGEVEENAYLALPLAESGEYYIGIYPILRNAHHYFPVVRKLKFVQGELKPVESTDVEVYAWPGNVCEAIFTPGVLPTEKRAVFPYTVDQVRLPDGCTATLFYENGLRIAVEEGMRIRYGTVLGELCAGRLLVKPNGHVFVLGVSLRCRRAKPLRAT